MLLQNIEAVISNHKNHSLVQIILPETLTRFQSVILGFDAYENEILLGGIYPRPSIEALEQLSDQPFWVQCNYQGQFLNIYVRACEILVNEDLISVKVLQSQLTTNRRWTPRASFESHKGPCVDVLPKYGATEKAWVKNISYHGALIECFGKDIRKSLDKNKATLMRIQFSKQFTVELKAVVKQCYFRRSPCCHSGMRVEFKQLGALEAMQIRDFIHQTMATPMVA